MTKINHSMKTKLTSAPVQITSQVSILPFGYPEVTGIAYLGLSLSFIHLKGLSLSQSKKFLFLLSLFNENGRREEGCKSQRHFLLKSVSGTVQKLTYTLCTKVCKLSWKCAVLFSTLMSGKKNKIKGYL